MASITTVKGPCRDVLDALARHPQAGTISHLISAAVRRRPGSLVAAFPLSAVTCPRPAAVPPPVKPVPPRIAAKLEARVLGATVHRSRNVIGPRGDEIDGSREPTGGQRRRLEGIPLGPWYFHP